MFEPSFEGTGTAKDNEAGEIGQQYYRSLGKVLQWQHYLSAMAALSKGSVRKSTSRTKRWFYCSRGERSHEIGLSAIALFFWYTFTVEKCVRL
ncbi:MAG: hypothetical protein RLP02_37830 [Coleofasciculus sp. C2-GNP5-27]